MQRMQPGDRFGRLVLLSKIISTSTYDYRWHCRCDCGSTIIVQQGNLRTGNTSSCGCFRLERLRKALVLHGKKHSPAYNTWCNMLQRCTNKKTNSYKNYGGRDIRVCQRWKTFVNFYTDMGDPPLGMTLERKDVNGSYCKKNCCWASRAQQARNTRTNRNLTYKGKTQCLKAWAEERGVKYWTYHARLRRGWSTEKIIETPLRKLP